MIPGCWSSLSGGKRDDRLGAGDPLNLGRIDPLDSGSQRGRLSRPGWLWLIEQESEHEYHNT
jgi:hypothetical protein